MSFRAFLSHTTSALATRRHWLRLGGIRRFGGRSRRGLLRVLTGGEVVTVEDLDVRLASQSDQLYARLELLMSNKLDNLVSSDDLHKAVDKLVTADEMEERYDELEQRLRDAATRQDMREATAGLVTVEIFEANLHDISYKIEQVPSGDDLNNAVAGLVTKTEFARQTRDISQRVQQIPSRAEFEEKVGGLASAEALDEQAQMLSQSVSALSKEVASVREEQKQVTLLIARVTETYRKVAKELPDKEATRKMLEEVRDELNKGNRLTRRLSWQTVVSAIIGVVLLFL